MPCGVFNIGLETRCHGIPKAAAASHGNYTTVSPDRPIALLILSEETHNNNIRYYIDPPLVLKYKKHLMSKESEDFFFQSRETF